MKIYIKKVLVILIAVFVLLPFVKGIIHVGDTVYNEPSEPQESINFNGYVPYMVDNYFNYLDFWNYSNIGFPGWVMTYQIFISTEFKYYIPYNINLLIGSTFYYGMVYFDINSSSGLVRIINGSNVVQVDLPSDTQIRVIGYSMFQGGEL